LLFFSIFFSYFFRLFPPPYKTGIIEINKPNKNSPVFITGNYALTVIRVKRALKKIRCYLLVANSRGMNVWCGATGGHFTSNDIISIFKVRGIEERVDKKIAILPQLAATRIGKKEELLLNITGWGFIVSFLFFVLALVLLSLNAKYGSFMIPKTLAYMVSFIALAILCKKNNCIMPAIIVQFLFLQSKKKRKKRKKRILLNYYNFFFLYFKYMGIIAIGIIENRMNRLSCPNSAIAGFDIT